MSVSRSPIPADLAFRPADVTLLHMNDVYHLEADKNEPVGGAARFASVVHRFDDLATGRPLFICSGDCFSPSIESNMTNGKHMAELLCLLGVDCATVGNHDLDFGVDQLIKLIQLTGCPWMCANVIDQLTGKPIAGVHETLMFERNGVKIGLLGVVEPWLSSISRLPGTY